MSSIDHFSDEHMARNQCIASGFSLRQLNKLLLSWDCCEFSNKSVAIYRSVNFLVYTVRVG